MKTLLDKQSLWLAAAVALLAGQPACIDADDTGDEVAEQSTGIITSSQINWSPLPALDSYTRPAMASLGHTESFLSKYVGKLYVVAIAHTGYMYYTASSAPGTWSAWQSVGPAPSTDPWTLSQATHFDSSVSPVALRNGNLLHVIAKGSDDNLYETHRTEAADWSNWRPITSDASVVGRFSIARTSETASGYSRTDFHVIYRAAGNSVESRVFSDSWTQQGPTVVHAQVVEATIASNGRDEVVAVMRTTDHKIRVEAKRHRGSRWDAFQFLSDYFVWNGRLYDLSNVVYFGGAYNVAYAVRMDGLGEFDSSYQHYVEHRAIRTAHAKESSPHMITGYVPAEDSHPMTQLAAYRNKLIAGYRDVDGYVRYAFWDTTDPTTPWIGNRNIAGGSTSHRPVLATMKKCVDPRSLECATASYGNDLYAAVHGRTTNRLYFINFSRTMFSDRLKRLGLAVRWCDEWQGTAVIGGCSPLADKPQIQELPVYTEVGYGTLTLPDWLMSRVFHRASPAGDYVTWINTDDIRAHIGPNINIDRKTNYITWVEEAGHTIANTLGLCDQGNCPSGSNVPGVNKLSDFVANSARDEAFTMFQKYVNWQCTNNTATDSCPETRVQGFAGWGNNYDVGSRQHSWMYTLIRSFQDGDLLRQRVNDDLVRGSDPAQQRLLMDKSNWARRYIFEGMEFRRNSDPLFSNDSHETPFPITTATFTRVENTSTASQSWTEPGMPCGYNGNAHTVWYAYTAPRSGTVTVTTAGSSYDTVVAAWTRDYGGGAWHNQACNDDSAGALTSAVSLSVTEGQTIYFQVAAYGQNNGGDLQLSLTAL